MAFQSKWGQAPLAPIAQQGPGLQEQALKWGANKALKAGINAAIPGGGLAAEGAQQFLPGVLGLNKGGAVYANYGQLIKEVYADPRYLAAQNPDVGGRSGEIRDVFNTILQEKLAGNAPAAPEAPAAPAPTPAPQPEQKGGYGVDWNVGLGNLGGWDLGTQGSYGNTGAGAGGDVNLTATKGFDVNRLFGAAPLAQKSEEVKQLAPEAATDAKLAPYLAAGISPDQAKMLIEAGAPPPQALNKGGDVEGKKNVPWWQQAVDYAVGKGRKGEGANSFLKGNVEHKNMGGAIPSYTPGPLGMKDMVSMSKDLGTGPLAGVKYKKQGGEIVDEVEVKFHGPKAPGSSSSDKQEDIMVYQPVPTQAGGTRYGDRYLNYASQVPVAQGTMGTDSQAPGVAGGGGGGTLGSASFTPPPATGAPPAQAAGTPQQGVAGSGTADTVTADTGVGFPTTAHDVQGGGFRQRTTPQTDPFTGIQTDTPPGTPSPGATAPAVTSAAQVSAAGGRGDRDSTRPADTFSAGNLGIVGRDDSGRSSIRTGLGTEQDAAARTTRRNAGEALGYDVGQSTLPEAIAGGLGIVSGVPGLGTAANFAVDRFGPESAGNRRIGDSGAISYNVGERQRSGRGQLGSIDPGTGGVYGQDGRAYDPVTGQALNVHNTAGDFANTLTSGYQGLRDAGHGRVASGLGSFENSTAHIGQGARDLGVTAASSAGLRNIAGEDSIADVLGGNFTPVTDTPPPTAAPPAPRAATPQRERNERRTRTATNQAARSRDTQRSISQSSFDRAIADAQAGRQFDTRTVSRPSAPARSTPKPKKEKKSKGGK